MSSSSAPAQRLITGYIPNLSLTIVASACFGALAVIFCYRFWRTRSDRWMLCLTIGTITMTAGFLARIPLTNSPGSLIIYIITTLFTLLSPCAFLAHNYILLPRLASYLSADDCLFLKPRLIAKIFVWIDVTLFLLQAAGGGLTAMSDIKIADAGLKIALAGLVIQCISFGTFCLLALVFVFKLRKRYPSKWSSSERTTWRSDWRIVYWALLWTCIFIMVRCIFRVAEFAEGYDGKLRTTEWYIYVFDTLPLFLAISVWAIIWPPMYMPNKPLGGGMGENESAGHVGMREMGSERGHRMLSGGSEESSLGYGK